MPPRVEDILAALQALTAGGAGGGSGGGAAAAAAAARGGAGGPSSPAASKSKSTAIPAFFPNPAMPLACEWSGPPGAPQSAELAGAAVAGVVAMAANRRRSPSEIALILGLAYALIFRAAERREAAGK